MNVKPCFTDVFAMFFGCLSFADAADTAANEYFCGAPLVTR